jgi:hypothetical protein
MADWLKKIPVLSDLLKDEQHNSLGREERVYNNATANPVLLGTVVQLTAGVLAPWAMPASPVAADLYGILLENVEPNTSAKVGVLIAGPAAIDASQLIWASDVQARIDIGLEALKAKSIFARPVVATGTYPEQIL